MIHDFLFETSVMFFPGSPTKRRMQNIGNVSILGMFVMYFFTAVFGYLTFYGEKNLFTLYHSLMPVHCQRVSTTLSYRQEVERNPK